MDSPYLYFAHVSEIPSGVLRCIPSGAGAIHWIFLGEDYSRFLHWKEAMPADSRPISFKRELDHYIETLSSPFSNIITSLGRIYDSPAWWASRISEKNNLVSPLFLHCCYLAVWDALIDKLHGHVVVIAEDHDLLKSARQIGRARGIDVKRKRWAGLYGEYVRMAYRALGRIIKFLWRSFQLSRAGGTTIPMEDRDGIVLIHTYVDESCLIEEGKFKDRYFTGLSVWLNHKGYHTMTLPVLFNIRRSYRSVWQWLKRAQGYFLNPFQYYRVTDYAFVLRESFRQQLMCFKGIKLNSVDVTRLFKAEQRRKAFESLDSFLYYRLPLRLVQAGFHLKRVIMPFENMIDEKMFNLGLKKYSKKTVSVGFQHGALFPALMCQFVSSDEAAFAPLSDKIVCSGCLFCNILAEKGIPKEKLEIGPALRYSYLSTIPTGHNKEEPRADVLVPLPLMRSDAVELLIKVMGAFGERTQLKILIKPHPMVQRGWLAQMISKLMLPPHFSIVEGNMEEQIRRVRMVVGMGSSTLMEVFAAGKPLIVVGRDTAIDFNPLGFLPGFSKICVTPEEIYRSTQEILNAEAEKSGGGGSPARIFSPVTEELMEAFLKN